MKKRVIAFLAACCALLTVVCLIAVAVSKSNPENETDEICEEQLPNEDASFLSELEEIKPEVLQGLYEKAESRENTEEAAIEYCKEIIQEQCSEFAAIPWEKCWVEIHGGGISSGRTETAWNFLIWYSIDGHKTHEKLNVSFTAYADGSFGTGYLASEHIGEYSKFDEFITEAAFQKAAAELNEKMDKLLEACGSETEKENLWLTICSNPKGVEDYSKLYKFTVEDGKLMMVMGLNPEISSVLVG